MKQFLTILCLSVLAVSPVLAAEQACKQSQTVATVDGMVCDFCTQSITKVLKKNSAVKDVAIDLDTKKVVVDVADGKDFSDKDMAKAIDYAGYKLIKVEHACKS